MPLEHARLSPSSAHRWLRCPGSVSLYDQITEERSSVYAAEGTVAHHVRESCLMLGLEPEMFLGEVIGADGFTFEVTQEMVDALRPGIDWVRERPGRLVNEMRVSFDRWLPGQFGTLDVGIIAPDLITINDLKYGVGVGVSPYQNEQLMTYALGFWDNVARHETDATDFLLVIDQPRKPGAGGEWYTTLDELLEHGERLKAGYAAIHEQEPVFNPGEKQCTFCEPGRRGLCAAQDAFVLEMLEVRWDSMEFDDEDAPLPDFEEFTPERRAYVAKNAALITKWVDGLKRRTLHDAILGLPTPGVKAIAGRKGARTWTDPDMGELFLHMHLDRKKVYAPAKLISPAEAEKLLPKDVRKDLEEYVTQSDTRPTLVDENHEKPALTAVADQFDDDEDKNLSPEFDDY